MTITKNTKHPSGYAVLLTILTLSVMITIGLTITTIIITQLRLTTRVFNTMKALAAADSGIEKGLYEDLGGNFITGGTPWTNPSPPPIYSITKSGLLAAYAFEEAAGDQNALDTSGNNRNGTLGSNLTPESSDPTRLGSGQMGSALTFDGVDDYVDTQYNPTSPRFNFTTGPFTITAWFKIDPSTVGPRLMIGKFQASNRQIYLMELASQKIMVGLYDSSGMEQKVTSTSTVNDGAWHHLAMVVSTTTITLFLDGNSNGTPQSYNNSSLNSINATWQIGRRGGSSPGSYFLDDIDEVRIYNRALSAAEVLRDKETPASPTSSTTNLTSVGTSNNSQRSVEVTY